MQVNWSFNIIWSFITSQKEFRALYPLRGWQWLLFFFLYAPLYVKITRKILISETCQLMEKSCICIITSELRKMFSKFRNLCACLLPWIQLHEWYEEHQGQQQQYPLHHIRITIFKKKSGKEDIKSQTNTWEDQITFIHHRKV